MIREIQAKVLLSHVKQPDTWFGLKYNMNLYRGCQHQCIYCDSRSECYRIENFNSEVAVSFTIIIITTADDELAKKLELGAPLVSKRLQAMKALAEQGIHTGIAMMPILPFIEDDEENIRRIIEQARAHGAAYILPWFGMSLRDRQRAYYYAKLDKLFPELRHKYQRTFGDQYHCAVPNAERLAEVFHQLCDRYGIATRMKRYQAAAVTQMKLF